MTPLFRKFLGLHWILFLAMILMMAFGVLCIYSAVHFRDGDQAGLRDMWNVQLKWGVLGLVPFFVASLIDYKWIRWGALPIFLVGTVLMVMVQLKGEEIYGSKSWLKIGGFQFQPSQFAICSTILMASVVLSDGAKYIPILKYHFLRCLAAMAIFCSTLIFILKEGDLGSAMVITPVIIIMLITGGIPFRYLISGGLLALIVLPWIYLMFLRPHQQARIEVWWRMLHGQRVDIQGDAYASYYNQIAIGSAGWEGKGIYVEKNSDLIDSPVDGGTESNVPHLVGLGNISKKTSHTDYIFTVLSETFGFRVAATLTMAFLLILLLQFMIAFFARDSMGRVLAAGVAGLIFGHAMEHIGMNIGLLPITGIPLPFISYGGTFIMVVLFLFGMVQSVWVHRNLMLQADNPSPANKPIRPMGRVSHA